MLANEALVETQYARSRANHALYVPGLPTKSTKAKSGMKGSTNQLRGS